MKPGKYTPQEIEQILDSMEGIRKAEMPPYFYTRLQARMEIPSSLEKFLVLLTKPLVTLLTLLVLVIINIAAISHYYTKADYQSTASETSGIQSFAREYNLTEFSDDNDKTNW